jgi:hypothetical protein
MFALVADRLPLKISAHVPPVAAMEDISFRKKHQIRTEDFLVAPERKVFCFLKDKRWFLITRAFPPLPTFLWSKWPAAAKSKFQTLIRHPYALPLLHSVGVR